MSRLDDLERRVAELEQHLGLKPAASFGGGILGPITSHSGIRDTTPGTNIGDLPTTTCAGSPSNSWNVLFDNQPPPPPYVPLKPFVRFE